MSDSSMTYILQSVRRLHRKKKNRMGGGEGLPPRHVCGEKHRILVIPLLRHRTAKTGKGCLGLAEGRQID